MKRKIAVTTGSRAEYGILRPLLKKITESKKLDLFLIVTGTHLSKKHGMTIKEIENDGFKISAKFNMTPRGDKPYHMSEALGKGIMEFSKIFNDCKPDINLVLGDRDEPFAAAIAACHMNIPNAHIHGGETSQSIDEYIRHAMTKLSNIHFAVTEKSKERIIKMGENSKFVFLTGSPSIDEVVSQKITSKKELEKKYKMKMENLILLVQHPVTSQHTQSKNEIINTLNAIISFKKNIIAISPNSDAGGMKILETLKEYSKKYESLKFFRNLPRRDYLGILQCCEILVGNSSSGLIEGSYFNTPIVNVGIRQKGRERGDKVFDAKNDELSITKAVKKALKSKTEKTKSNIYGIGKSSSKIVKILETIPIDQKLIQKQITY